MEGLEGMSHEFIWEDKGVYWGYHGEVTGKEILEASAAIYGDPRFDTLRYKLVNFLDVENIEMNENEVAQIAFQHKAAAISNPNIKNAIVVGPNMTDLAKHFASFFEGSEWEVQIFHNVDEANDWLDRKPALQTEH